MNCAHATLKKSLYTLKNAKKVMCDRRMDGPTDGQTDIVTYRVACTRLNRGKNDFCIKISQEPWGLYDATTLLALLVHFLSLSPFKITSDGQTDRRTNILMSFMNCP